nr:MAG: antibiotic biosynthesis monooxygenase [Pseudomonadota bacterium]
MVNEYLRYRIAPERADAFLEAYGRAAEWLRASEHCLGYHLARCVDEPEVFVLRIDWDSPEGHLQGFRRSEAFQRFFAHVAPFVGNIEEMRHYAPTGLEYQRASSPESV